MHHIATALNKQLEVDYPHIWRVLSDLGKRIYFPKGILAQSQEAALKATLFNATIGISTEHKKPMHLPQVQGMFNDLPPSNIYGYAPAGGRKNLRNLWWEKIKKTSPMLSDVHCSLPIATSGITHAIALAAQMFVKPGDKVVIPEQNWENYHLIFEVEREATIASYPLFNKRNRFNVEGLKRTLLEVLKTQDQAVVVLNFPNNPTGYSLTDKEQDEIVHLLTSIASPGKFLMVLCDDAYFGLFFENDLAKQSLFAKLANVNQHLLAIKLDGPTKEFFMWGFRLGFITFGYNNAQKGLYDILEQKITGLIRAKLSNCSHPAQSILEKILTDSLHQEEAHRLFLLLQERALKVKKLLSTGRYAKYFDFYPFNAGYFMCIILKDIPAEKLRLKLLDDYQIGTISFGKYDLRIAFSSLDLDDIDELFEKINLACEELHS
ncbi:MAG: aminotransferase class I/II-fold pyridoxal phosphate-dependent enzyme [SAR324 cluster bacterium]|nr:aminotransferase class I/II-fold pyridoxal phosphate-dependent enzyme [SAR324 cluster bacterium]